MKAVVFHGKGDVRIEDVEKPTAGKGQVLIKPAFCGICGTDLHEFLGGENLIPKPGSPHPLTGQTSPVTLGHEFSGVVQEVGEGVSKFKSGDRVVIEPILWDGSCQPCKVGAENCCDKGGFLGLSGGGGGLSELVAVKEESVYHIPDNVSLEIGALVEPLAVGWHAVKVSPHKKGDNVLVIGGGPIGLSVIQALKAQGSSSIIVSEMAGRRKDFAKSFGATHIIDPSQEDVIAKCRELTGGQGVDVVFDCAGVQAALESACQAMRIRGTLVNIAIWEGTAVINPTKMLLKEQKYMGIVTYARNDFQEVLDAISSGKITPEGMITKKIKMDEVVEQGFRSLINEKDKQVKILVDMS